GPQDDVSAPIRKGLAPFLAGPAPPRSSPLLTRSTTRATHLTLLGQCTPCTASPTPYSLHTSEVPGSGSCHRQTISPHPPRSCGDHRASVLLRHRLGCLQELLGREDIEWLTPPPSAYDPLLIH